MILLVHEKARCVVQVYRNSEEISFSADLCKAFWKLAEEYPDELLVWVEKDLFPLLRSEKLKERFDHDLIMSSYAIKTKFLSGEIGYVDQLPFINVKRGVKYPTWRMSSDIGGIKANTLGQFHNLFRDISNFDYLLNSVAKLGQQNGLFCYSDPHLIEAVPEKKLYASAGNRDLFSFIYQHYNSIWSLVLFFCLMKYERRFPVGAFLKSFSKPKFFNKDIDLPDVQIPDTSLIDVSGFSVDVIIPTIGRAEYVRQVIEDLSHQSLLPKQVIIVEQQPDENSGSEIQDLLSQEWPFQIVHIFTRRTGACMARNRALEKIESEWIFFADDDIRLEKEVLRNTLKEAVRLRVDCINLNCKQVGEETVFYKVKQWGSFGSGTSVVRSRLVEGLKFSEAFEHGYGEDVDFGMKLREAGCDIIYHPELKILHLKAPVGGFRKKPELGWETEDPKPKPSPTVMMLGKRYYTSRQMKGFKISLYLKYFKNQKNKNVFTYLKQMERKWKKSEAWAEKITVNN